MMYELASFVQEYITQNNSTLFIKHTTLHEQMLQRVEKTTKDEKERAIEAKTKQQEREMEATLLENRTLDQKIREELMRKEEMLKEEKRRKKELHSKHVDQFSGEYNDGGRGGSGGGSGYGLDAVSINFETPIMISPEDSQVKENQGRSRKRNSISTTNSCLC